MDQLLNAYIITDENGKMVNKYLSSSVASLLNYLSGTYNYKFEVLETKEDKTFVRIDNKTWIVEKVEG